MPWEISVVSPSGASLGSVAAVEDTIARFVEGIAFYTDPSGAEKIAAMEVRGIDPPEVLRAALARSPASRRGDLERGGLHARFHLGPEGSDVGRFDVEIRGEGDPASVLGPLLDATGWTAADARGRPIEIRDAKHPRGWAAFRDRVASVRSRRRRPWARRPLSPRRAE